MSNFSVNSRQDHFEEMTALLFLEKQLDAAREREAAAHFDSCSECRQLLQVLGRETLWMQAAIAGDESLPAHLALKPRRVAQRWGWMTAAGLGLAGAYAIWAEFFSPWLDQDSFSQGNIVMTILFSGVLWKGWDAVQIAMQFLAGVTLLSAAIWLLRRHLRRTYSVGIVLTAMAMAFTLVPSARAADVKHGQPNFVLPAGQETRGDLIVNAKDITRIDGDVNGDLIVRSTSVTVNGHVKGDILGFVRELRVNGTVDGNLRSVSHSLILNGTVGKNVTSWSGNFDMDSKAQIGGSLILGANNAELDGKIGSDLVGLGHSLHVDGTIGGDLNIRAEHFNIGSNASIAGRAKYVGPSRPGVANGAQLVMPLETVIRQHGPNYASPRFFWDEILFWGVIFVLGLAMLLIAPGFFFDAASSARRIGASFGHGALFLILVPIAVVIACATIVGLAVGITTLLSYIVALFTAQIFVGEWIGEKLMGPATGTAAMSGRLALGLAVVRVIAILPFVGPLLYFAVVLWGLGAMALAGRRRLRTHTIAPAAA
jgi:cytoskeletal protein CcmA (bactofilin family)